MNISMENILQTFIEGTPVGKTRYDRPWFKFVKTPEKALFIAPKRVMDRPTPYSPHVEVDGMQYEWRDSEGKVVGHTYQTTFDYFLEIVLPKELEEVEIWQLVLN